MRIDNVNISFGGMNVGFNDPPPYAFSSYSTSIDEGSTGNISVSTFNVPDNTLVYWTIANTTTSNVDFSNISGNVTISGGTGSFSIGAVTDFTLEGTEQFTVQIRTGSNTGPIVASTNIININDTSTGLPAYFLYLWGQSQSGSAGTDATGTYLNPTQTVTNGASWSVLKFSSAHTVAIKPDTTLWTWGHNNYGQLGTNDIIHRSSPVQTVAGGTGWLQVAAGASTLGGSTVAIKSNGTLWTWGCNNNGQLGDNTTISTSSPIQTIAGGSNWSKLEYNGGFGHAAIKTDGTLWLWGRNNYGQLGVNDIIHRSSPVQTIAGGNNWANVTHSVSSTVTIKTDGTLWTWGNGNSIGDNTVIRKSSPVQTIAGGNNWKQVSTNGDHTGAIKTDGTLWMWGSNTQGRLGDNTTINSSSPIQTISGGTSWRQVSTSSSITSAIKNDGTLWTWGYAHIGDGFNVNKSSPVQTSLGGTDWVSVSGGGFMIGGLKNS
jgi:alpha-tubulin suppressor-like RCC1 family protein